MYEEEKMEAANKLSSIQVEPNQPKYEQIDEAIYAQYSSLEILQDLIDRMRGVDVSADKNPEPPRPRPSLMDFLDGAPTRVRENTEMMLRMTENIREMLL